MRRSLVRARVESAHLPAPVGGLNTIDAGSAMPPLDCLMAWNLIASEHGLRTRLGWKEYANAINGAADNAIRTMLPFTGSAANGAQDRLFAVTSNGIYSTLWPDPERLVEFADKSLDAGYGVSTSMVTLAGRFLLYCDERNGLYRYSEADDAWTKIVVGTRQAWAASTLYAIGNRVTNGGNVYVCDQAGTSAAAGGPTGTGADIADNGARWDYVSAESTTAIGPSLADQNLGYSADPANFAHATVWKNRVWFTEKDTSRGWYLDINAIYGVATSFNFGAKMRAGGPLVGLYNWSYDGGAGLDTALVGISTAGDIIIYLGTDPTSAATFGLKGCWSVGAVPVGRNIATDYGGDLLVLSAVGVEPLSRLVVGGAQEDRGRHATAKISNLFSQLMASRRTRRGWAVFIHPTENALVVTVPTDTDVTTEQLVFSFGAKSWSRFRGLNMVSAAVWGGELYFGNASGQVCRNVDHLDGSLLDGTVGADVAWSLLTAYRNLGNMRHKQVTLIRPTLLTSDISPVIESTARYGYNLVEVAAPSATAEGAGGWDSDLWDAGVWGGEYMARQPLQGAVGMGRDVAIAIRGRAKSRTALVGIDVLYEQGGVL